MQHKKRKNILIVLGVLVLILAIATSTFGYLSDAYEPQRPAIEALQSTNDVTVIQGESYISFEPKEHNFDSGLIFYQGGKVEEEAYAPLMKSLAEKGISVYLVRMPFNLAVFNSDAAEEVIKDHEEISNWYLSGHSLGGVMAASFAEKQAEEFEGIIFLASYPAGEFSASSLDILSIYGSNDEVLNGGAYTESFNQVLNEQEKIIEGGNHAQFGNYGPQKGDGSATITTGEQQQITVDAIIYFIEETVKNNV